MVARRNQRLQELWRSLPPRFVMEIEQQRGTFVRRDPEGRIMYVSPLPLLFNYGAAPGTLAEDGFAMDVLLVGGGRYAVGDQIEVRAFGLVDFEDGADWDPKVLVRPHHDPRPPNRLELILVALLFPVLARIKSSRFWGRRGSLGARYSGMYLARKDGGVQRSSTFGGRLAR